MKKHLATFCLACLTSLTRADVIADWTFEGTPTSTTTPATIFIYGGADTGNQTGGSSVSGLHASASTGWTFPAGNGSTKGFDADHWGVGDYFQFSVSTVDYQNILLAFDQISSSTGPGEFILEYSTTGTGGTFNNYGSDYAITVTGWSSSSHTASSTFTIDLSSINGLNNNSSVIFRLVDDSTTSEGGGTVGTSGASHMDNFIVSGDLIPVPEPAAWGAIYGAGALAFCGIKIWRGQRGVKCAALG